MSYWIFAAAPQSSDDEKISGREIYERRTDDRFWGLNERTPHRENVEKGDRVIFYIARPESAFVGEAELTSPCVELDQSEKQRLTHDTKFFTATSGVYLRNVRTWEEKRPVTDLAGDLQLIPDPSQWWVYLQGGIHEIDESDYQRMRRGER